MRRLINYIRSCYCKHDWELLREVRDLGFANNNIPIEIRLVYRCRKCGYVRKDKI